MQAAMPANPSAERRSHARHAVEMRHAEQQDKARVAEIARLKAQMFHKTPPIPWAEVTAELFGGGVADLRMPMEGKTSRPFFLSVRRPGREPGLIVVKFMPRGSCASYFFGDRILRQLGAITPGFRFLQPARPRDRPEIDAIAASVRLLIESELTFGGGAVLDTASWELSDGDFTVFGQTFPLLINRKSGKQPCKDRAGVVDFLQKKAGTLLATCTVSIDEASGAIFCDRRDSMTADGRFPFEGVDEGKEVGWFHRLRQLEEGSCEAVMVFEYVNGSALNFALQHRAARRVEGSGQEELGPVIQKIGEMLVGDLLLNNNDRFRLKFVPACAATVQSARVCCSGGVRSALGNDCCCMAVGPMNL